MTINLNDFIGTSAAIPLAKQGEFGREVSFDFSEWVEMFGSGSIGWSIQRPQDTSAYLLPSTEDGTVSVITLTETESQKYGYGLLEVFYVNTGETEKRISKTFSFRIDKSLQNLGQVPSPWQSYVDAVHEDAVKAEEASQSILDLTATATVDANVGTPSVSVEVSTEDDHKNMAFAFSNIKGEQGEQGETGNGISSVSVEKTATVGNVDTYTMTIAYTDGDSDTATFDITNSEVTEEEFEKAFPVDVAQGSIASYPDGADMPVKDLKVSVTPVQDLHGYANPWVGGGGINLLPISTAFDETVTDIRFQCDGNGKFIISGTSAESRSIDVNIQEVTLPNEDIYLHLLNNEANSNVNIFFLNGSTSLGGLTYGAVNRIYKMTALSGKTFNKIRLIVGGGQTVNITTSPMLMKTNTVTAYTPYSNICPITGWTGANVVRTGFNLWDEQWESGKYSATGVKENDGSKIRSKNYIPAVPNTTYYFYATGSLHVCYYDADKTFISYVDTGSQARTTPSNCYFITFSMFNAYGTTYNNDISINYPSTDHEYHAYSGNTYSFDFGQTVYGGTLDVTSGVLTIDRAMVTYDGSDDEYWLRNENAGFIRYLITNSNAKVPTGRYGGICNIGKFISTGNEVGGFFWYPYSSSLAEVFYYPPQTITDLTAYRAWLSENNLQVVYELASPQTVQLSPTEVKSLLGQNNIFADCGDSEVEYLADVTLYIQKLTGSTEDDMVANQNIANNKYFLVGSRLFFSTSAIAVGASIIPGTNCTETNLADALNALNS